LGSSHIENAVPDWLMVAEQADAAAHFDPSLPFVRKARPIIKWAGGKSQLLGELRSAMPSRYNKYIEPFVGGGALFFALGPRPAVIGDSNPELVNLYQVVRDAPQRVAKLLSRFENAKDAYYEIRSLKYEELEPDYAAARMIYLNRTCFNGLYRVNRKGQFNVPFGNYRRPNLCRNGELETASKLLKGTDVILADYKALLKSYAYAGDFVFLDPPYLPVSKYADFKRYTKEQFGDDDHIELAKEVDRLASIGCHVVLTNSNHPLVHRLYARYQISIHQTKRHISSKPQTRIGEDVIVVATNGTGSSCTHQA